MTHYANSPACRMLATHCCACGRPLVDADSVELGIGPICRRRHGFNEPDADADFDTAIDLCGGIGDDVLSAAAGIALGDHDARKACNAVVYAAARHQGTPLARRLSTIIHALGYHTLAAKVATHAGAVATRHATHDQLGDTIAVKSPRHPGFKDALRRRGAWYRWERATKSWHVRKCDRGALWAALCECYPGIECTGPNGITTIPAASTEAA